MNPIISVIVTTFNRSNFLMKTISSILDQTFNDFELIIVNDGSTDNTVEMVKSIDDERVRVISIENCGLPAKVRNIGIKNAKGKFIAFCDDDDYWDPFKLGKQLKHFEDETVVGVGSQMKYFGEVDLFRDKRCNKDLYCYFNDVLDNNIFPLSSIVIRNNNFKFDENPELRYVEDYDFLLNILRLPSRRLKFLKEPLVYYRIHSQNSSRQIYNVLKANLVIKKYSSRINFIQKCTAHGNIYFTAAMYSLRFNDYNFLKFFGLSFVFGNYKIKIKSLFGIILVFFPKKMIRFILSKYT